MDGSAEDLRHVIHRDDAENAADCEMAVDGTGPFPCEKWTQEQCDETADAQLANMREDGRENMEGKADDEQRRTLCV